MIHRLLKPRTDDARSETIWLTVYSDLITNLVLVFLALYGLILMGDDALSKAIQSMKLDDIRYIEQVGSTLTFDDLPLLLRQELKSSDHVIIREEPGAVRIELGEDVLFASGRADLKGASFETFSKVARLLVLVPYTIVVEGHTDNVPLMLGSRFKNNRELALARAMSVIRHLIEKEGVPPKQVAAGAYGSFRPRASNVTAEGRGLNRRVEIAIFKDFPFSA